MAAPVRRRAPSLEELLYSEPYRFDFYQAVALIEHARPEAARVGETAEPGREAVRFDSHITGAFPASDVLHVERARPPDGPVHMTISFMGLAGAHGPLPPPVTEIIQERVRQRDTTLKAFLDIFNHRLVSLMYRARKVNRFWIGARAPDNNPFARYLFALAGLGTPGLKRRMRMADRALLPYAGLLARVPRTQVGLARQIAHQFGVPARIVPCRGRWLPLEQSQRTVIGRPGSGSNNALGRTVVVGARVWDRMSLFELNLGPMPLKRFRALLPGEPAYGALVDTTRFYAGDQFDFDIRLRLDPAQMPPTMLAAKTGSLLGWTSWLKSGHDKSTAAEILLSPRRLPPSADHPASRPAPNH
jgi:type VI secretion system protein ImpH